MPRTDWESVVIADADAALPYRAMTFPRFKPLLRGAGTLPTSLAIGARTIASPHAPIGLALVYLTPDGHRAELMSVFVDKAHRHQGIGRALVEIAEGLVVARGFSLFSTVYMDRSPSIPWLERILAGCGWGEPELRYRVVRTEIANIFNAPIAGRVMAMERRSGQALEIAPWRTVTARERRRIAEDVAAGIVPADLNPFDFEGVGIDGAEPEPAASFVCRLGGEVMGWHLVHRVNRTTVRFTCSFMHIYPRRALAMATLWGQALRASRDAGFSTVSWSVAPHSEGMERFTERFLAEHAHDDNRTWGREKALARAQ